MVLVSIIRVCNLSLLVPLVLSHCMPASFNEFQYTAIKNTTDAKLLNFLSHEDGAIPLGTATENGHTETVRRLLEAGATVNYQDKKVSIKSPMWWGWCWIKVKFENLIYKKCNAMF